MLYLLPHIEYLKPAVIISAVAAFVISLTAYKYLSKYLPHDMGREFAVNGQLSKGKPRGAGIILVIIFILTAVISVPFSWELLIYFGLVAASMLSGFLDDRSAKSWSEYIKAVIDFGIAAAASAVYVIYNPESTGIQIFDNFIILPDILFIALMTILIWASINVTNCADGVDGLCGSLSAVSLVTFYIILVYPANIQNSQDPSYAHAVLLMIACIFGYLWFNISPSKLLMGDAGSRAVGFFIAIAAVKSNSALLYVLIAFVLLADGGLGLIKISLLRFFKIHIFKKTRMPLHDFFRQDKKWSDPQVVYRFTAVQVLISFLVLFIFVFV